MPPPWACCPPPCWDCLSPPARVTWTLYLIASPPLPLTPGGGRGGSTGRDGYSFPPLSQTLYLASLHIMTPSFPFQMIPRVSPACESGRLEHSRARESPSGQSAWVGNNGEIPKYKCVGRVSKKKLSKPFLEIDDNIISLNTGCHKESKEILINGAM